MKIPGSERFDTKMSVHTATQNTEAVLALEFQKHFSNAPHKHGILDHGIHTKISSKQKWTDIEYHVQNNKDVEHQYVKVYCVTNHFSELQFIGP